MRQVSRAGMLTGLLGGVDEATLVICLLSGGASSLLVAPLEGVSLEEKRRTTGLLLKCGASINELNAVRKHLSRIKGGRLAELASPATVLTLSFSVVIGDRVDVIASGPTVPDSTTFAEAMKVVGKYGIAGSLPASVMRTLRDGIEGRLKVTLKGASGSTPPPILRITARTDFLRGLTRFRRLRAI